MSGDPQPRPDVEPDLIERLPVLERTTTRLEQSFGPSCLLSLIIVALLVIVFKRALNLSLGAMIVLAALVWIGVLTLLLRWRADVVRDDE